MTNRSEGQQCKNTVFLNPSVLGRCHLMLRASFTFVTFYKGLFKNTKQAALPSQCNSFQCVSAYDSFSAQTLLQIPNQSISKKLKLLVRCEIQSPSCEEITAPVAFPSLVKRSAPPKHRAWVCNQKWLLTRAVASGRPSTAALALPPALHRPRCTQRSVLGTDVAVVP